MITRLVSSAFFISLALGTVPKLNEYMDETVKKLPLQALVLDADPVELPQENFLLKGNGFSERDLEVNITRGSVSGLGSIKRRGNCSYDYNDNQPRRSCYLTLDNLRIQSKVDVTARFRSVQDDSAFTVTHTLSTSTRFENDSFLLLQLSQKDQYYHEPSMETLKLFPVSMTSSFVRGIPYLIRSRMSAFGEQLNAAVAKQVSSIISRKLYGMIKNSTRNRQLPRIYG